MRILPGTPPSCPPQSFPLSAIGDTPDTVALHGALSRLVGEAGLEASGLSPRAGRWDLQLAGLSV